MTDANTRPTDPAPRRPGLRLYCDSHDLLPRQQAITVAKLTRAGAVGAIAMVEGITGDRGSRLIPLEEIRTFVDRCGDVDVDVIGCAFPDVRSDHEHSLEHLTACLGIGCSSIELDAEPRGGAHWTPALVAPWLALSPDLSITTTRHEALRIGRVGRHVRGQLEQIESVDTLEAAMRKLEQLTPRARIEPVIGTFDQRGLIRTPAMIQRDLYRLTPQARLAGGLSAWAAHTTSREECEVLRAWALETWAPPKAA